jgi:hypothetical protein
MPSGALFRRYILESESDYLSPLLYLPLCWLLYVLGLVVLADTPPPPPAVFLILCLTALVASFLSLTFAPVIYEADCTWKEPVSASFYALGNSFLVGVLFAVVGKASGGGLLPGEVYALICIVALAAAHAGYGLYGTPKGAILLLISSVATALVTGILSFCLIIALFASTGAYYQFLAESTSSALAPLSTLLLLGGPVAVLGIYGVRWISRAGQST